MKKLLFYLWIVPAVLAAQESKRYEFGSTLLTFNVGVGHNENSFFHEKPPVEIMNGLFFRYKINRWWLRAHTAYSEYAYSYTPFAGCEDCQSGALRDKEFRVGLGMQYSLVKTQDWFYAFADIAYRNVFLVGTSDGGIAGGNVRYNYTSNGINSSLGTGFRFRFFKVIMISPEVGYTMTNSAYHKIVTDVNRGTTDKYRISNMDLSLMMRLHATVNF